MPRFAAVLGIFALLASSLLMAGVLDFSPGLLRYVTSRWGAEAVERLQEWRGVEIEYADARQKSPPSLPLSWHELKTLNGLWNKIPYDGDRHHWGMEDYWATPVEMRSSNGGDCEDYSIAKYFTLKDMGIPVEQLRIVYVRAMRLEQAHMVLAYYPTPDADPYILDNLTGKVLKASERTDLEPVYSFNDEDLWAAGISSFKGKSSQIRLWQDLLEKMEKERKM